MLSRYPNSKPELTGCSLPCRRVMRAADTSSKSLSPVLRKRC